MKRHWDVDELVEHWTLLPDEQALLANKTGATRLGFAVLLRFFQLEGRFPYARNEIPAPVIAFIAKQVGVPTADYLQYDWGGRTIKQHRAQIRDALGFREATLQDAEELTAWLCTEVVPHEHRLDQLKAALAHRCRALRIEPPAAGRIDRLTRSALRTYETQLFATILQRLPPSTVAQLDALVTDPAESDPPAHELGRMTVLDLRSDPGRAGLESVLQEIAKLRRIRQIGLPIDLFHDVTPRLLQTYRQRAAAEPPSALRAHPAAIRTTLLAALCWVRSQEITDNLADLLIQVVHRIGQRAEHKVEREILSDLKRVTGKTTLLFQIAEAAANHPDATVKAAIYPVVSERTLQDLVKEYKATGPAYRRHIHTVMRSSYRNHYRRMLPPLLDVLEFRSNNEVHRPVIHALALLKQYAGTKYKYYPPEVEVPIEGVIRRGWRDIIIEEDQDGTERISRVNYEFCVLQALRERLRCKEIWIVGADRFRNPELDLPQDFDVQRTAYYAALDQPLDAERFIADLQQRMMAALTALDANVPKNSAITLRPTGTKRIKLSPLEPQAEPVNLARLKTDIAQRWSMTSLLDVLKETDLLTSFTDHFTSVASRETLDRATLQKRLLLCLYGLGTNTGLKRISAGDGASTYQDLRYVRRRFIHRDQLRAAIAHVVNAIFRARLPQIWGEGTTACASDSKKFGAWDQNLLTEWHIRYHGRGVMIYWHVEKNSTCIYSQLKTCSSSEVAAMIEGVLRHCTEMTVDRQFVDSHGQSEIAFGFCELLNFALLPRLKAISKQKLYLPHAGQVETYPNLQPILTRAIDWECIRQQYDQMIKYATALRLGTAETEAILRRFTRSNVQHPTYKALAELGKAVKTIFLCEYLRSEALRREIHEGLNVIESWNSANTFIFYGKGSELTTNRLDDQEVAVLALHLLQNCLVYINTLMIQEMLTDQQWGGRMTAEDLRALSPLMYAHINPYGTFLLDMDARLGLQPSDGEVAA
jgi:TnpA family transposase